jgi:hypothetical protein
VDEKLLPVGPVLDDVQDLQGSAHDLAVGPAANRVVPVICRLTSVMTASGANAWTMPSRSPPLTAST